ncbi:hypothetical protein SAMN05216421_1152 [Halopseudomonas xinjiangensis]|uniref:Uncharacterized protein n=1 Tax=Halopseudomonas xinjiangensis TaxID=487184 RepID=A0A1H1QJF9_9GAMM|nr:hypothetical protein [Halopseudomonas xinjiangensis]SDS23590.1 hypothetical protein SAMN05216421_1152 [Halopseudomonas xinjiangensis]
MKELKMLSAALFATTLVFAGTAGADDKRDDHMPHHNSPAEDAGGTPGEKGVGGSVEVPSAGGGAEDITPYDDVGNMDDEENRRERAEEEDDDGVRGVITGEKSLHETQETR